MAQFKMMVLWSAWSAQVQSRVLRDILSLQRVTRNRAEFVVYCDELLRANVKALGVEVTTDPSNPQMCCIYLMNGTEMPPEIIDRLPELPDGVEPQVYSLFGDAEPTHRLSLPGEDPYAGVKFYDDSTRINETMPLDRPASPNPHVKHPEPLYSPYL